MKRILKWGTAAVAVAGLTLAFGDAAFAQEAVPTIEEAVGEATIGMDTMWLMVAAILVFLMQAGFALLEAGSIRSKNTINVLMKNLLDLCFGAIAYMAVGWAFMYGEGTAFIGLDQFFLAGVEGSDLAGWFFQMVFAATAATIVSGAVAERTKFAAYAIFSVIITAIIYPISGHWVWSGQAWLFDMGFRDFAGSTVVHSLGGWAALMGAIVVGPRIGRFNKDGSPNKIAGHSMPLLALGTFILWFGWFGFNPGSQLAAYGQANADGIALTAVTTVLAAAAGGIAAMTYTWVTMKKPDLMMSAGGVLGGLVAITAPCAYVSPASAVIIGLIGGVLVPVSMGWMEKLKIDDPVGAVPVHLVAGVWGTLAVGIFGNPALLGSELGLINQIGVQLIGIGAFAVWGAGMSYLMFFLIDKTIGMRVSEEEELRGLDFDEHGALAYPEMVAGPGEVAPIPAVGGSVGAPAQ